MPDLGDVDDRFRTAARDLDERPIRWTRVARAKRRYRWIAVLTVIALTASITGVALVGKRAVDPQFQVPLLEARVSEPPRSGPPDRQRLAEFLRDQGQPTTGLSRAERLEPGLVFSVRVEVEGGAGMRLPMTWSMHHAETERRLEGDLYRQTSFALTPQAREHSAIVRFWVPYPPRPGRYFIRYTLEGPDGRIVDASDTEEFQVRSVPPIP